MHACIAIDEYHEIKMNVALITCTCRTRDGDDDDDDYYTPIYINKYKYISS